MFVLSLSYGPKKMEHVMYTLDPMLMAGLRPGGNNKLVYMYVKRDTYVLYVKNVLRTHMPQCNYTI